MRTNLPDESSINIDFKALEAIQALTVLQEEARRIRISPPTKNLLNHVLGTAVNGLQSPKALFTAMQRTHPETTAADVVGVVADTHALLEHCSSMPVPELDSLICAYAWDNPIHGTSQDVFNIIKGLQNFLSAHIELETTRIT